MSALRTPNEDVLNPVVAHIMGDVVGDFTGSFSRMDLNQEALIVMDTIYGSRVSLLQDLVAGVSARSFKKGP